MTYRYDRPRFATWSVANWCPCCQKPRRLFAFGDHICAECYVDYVEAELDRLRAVEAAASGGTTDDGTVRCQGTE